MKTLDKIPNYWKYILWKQAVEPRIWAELHDKNFLPKNCAKHGLILETVIYKPKFYILLKRYTMYRQAMRLSNVKSL